jgi:hypothetical protein
VVIPIPLPGTAGATYDIVVGRGVLAELPRLLRERCPAHRYALITDSRVGTLYGERMATLLADAALRADTFTFPAYRLFANGNVTINTNSRHASFARTKRFASRAWLSRTWSRTTAWPSPLVMLVGVSSSASLNTKPPGMAERWSRLTRSIRPPNAALTAAMCLKPFL